MAEATNKGAIRRENEAKIMEAAELVFAEQGYRGASVGMIADAAGVPKPNVYYYFNSKDDLYRAVVANICESWIAAGDKFREDGDPRDAICDYVQCKMDLTRSRPQASRLWATEMARGAPILEEYVHQSVQPWLREKEAVLTAWIAAGKIQPVDPKAFFYMIWSATQHYADFEAQVTILNGGKPLSSRKFNEATRNIQTMVMRAVGLDACAE